MTRIYTWKELRDFKKERLFEKDEELTIDLSAIYKPFGEYMDALQEEELYKVETPLGKNPRQKSDLLRYLFWLLMFRTFRRGILDSFKSEKFFQYGKREPWYVLVGEHDQALSLAAEWNKNDVKPLDIKELFDPKKEIYENIENLVSNRNIEEPTDILFKFLETNGGFEEVLSKWSALDFKSYENKISTMLLTHYEKAISRQTICGGLHFEWGLSSDKCNVFGYAFTYENPL